MKFRTEIEIAPLAARIGYENRTLALGSCFAEHIVRKLADAKFPTVANPTGILFNPRSLASAVERYSQPVTPEELHHDGEVWFHYEFHGDFSASTPEEALAGMNAARAGGAAALAAADRVLVTFGTAWVYERAGEVVANCHRQPASSFVRRRLTVREIADRYDALLSSVFAGKEVIFTVSPVRHLGETLAGNAVSKATLRLAVDELCERHVNAHYFPAFEILTDDLRDYRFYADDLVHPAPQAIRYIWDRFTEAALSPQAQQWLPLVEQLVAAAAHRPRNPHSEAHRRFCGDQLRRIAALQGVDFAAEAEYFRQSLEINS